MTEEIKIPVSVQEDVAKYVYDNFAEILVTDPLPKEGKPEWVPWGNSHAQTECRRRARDILEIIYGNGDMLDLEKSILDRAVDRMTWDEINEFNAEIRKGQDVREDAGGYMMRCIRRLFGRADPPTEIESYQSAARRMMRSVYGDD